MFVHAPQWNVKVTDSLRPRTAENGGSVVKFASLAEEIEIEGERFLRQQMKASMLEKEEERKRRERLAEGVVTSLSYRRMGVDVQPGDLAPLDKANLLVSSYISLWTRSTLASTMLFWQWSRISLQFSDFSSCFYSHVFAQYASLVKQSDDKLERADRMRRDSEDSIVESEIAAFNRLKRDLAVSVPSDQKHLLDGLLYYKVSSFSAVILIQEVSLSKQIIFRTEQPTHLCLATSY